MRVFAIVCSVVELDKVFSSSVLGTLATFTIRSMRSRRGPDNLRL